MTTPKEITATEKLLELIRASSVSPPPEVMVVPTMEPQEALSEDLPAALYLEELSHDSHGLDDGLTHVIPQIEPSEPVAPAPLPPPLSLAVEDVSVPDPGPRLTTDMPPSLSLVAEDVHDPEPGPRIETDGEDSPSAPPPFVYQPKPPSLVRSAVSALRQGLQSLRPSSAVVIAVDIQPGIIHLVKSQRDNSGHTLLACQSVTFADDSDSIRDNLFEDQDFKAVLFPALTAMLGTHAHAQIWCSYAYCNPVGLHNIAIPKVEDKEISNAVFWSAKRELDFDETTSLFDYTVLQETVEANQTKIQTLVSLVPREEVVGVEGMFRSAGFPLTGLTFPAAAIQNFLEQDTEIPTDKPVAYFTVRKRNSFIDIYYQGKMFFSREIKTGTESFVESLLDQAIKQGILLDEENAKDYLFRVNGAAAASAEIMSSLDFDQLAVIERLVRQLTRTFEYCNTNFKTPPVSRILTSGECTVNDAILRAIEARIGIPCLVLDPFTPQIFRGGIEAPVSARANLLVAAGLSLSDKATTANFLFTHAERFVEAATNRVNSMIAIASIGLTIGTGAFFAWQYHVGLAKRATVASMRAELERKYQAEPRSRSSEYASQTIERVSQFHQESKKKVERFKLIVLMSELTKKIGPEIRLTDLTVELAMATEPLTKTKEAAKKEAPRQGSVRLNGYIVAPPDSQEFILMNLLKMMSSLTLLADPLLTAKESTVVQDQAVLRFEINLKTALEAPAS